VVSASPSNPDERLERVVRVESDLLDPEVVVAEDQPSQARVAEAEEVVDRNLEAAEEADAEFHLHNYAKEFSQSKLLTL
jgi:hypothetical protein